MPELDIGEGEHRSHDCNNEPVPPLHFFFPSGVGDPDGPGVSVGVGLGSNDPVGCGVAGIGEGMLFHALGGPIDGS